MTFLAFPKGEKAIQVSINYSDLQNKSIEKLTEEAFQLISKLQIINEKNSLVLKI